MIALEPNVLSELLRPSPAPQGEARNSFAAVGETELRHGVALLPAGRRRAALGAAIDGVLEEDIRDRMLPFDREATRAFAAIAAKRCAAGRSISQFDCQIAAIAQAHGASVATRSTGDYEGCAVALIDPWGKAKGQ